MESQDVRGKLPSNFASIFVSRYIVYMIKEIME